MMTTCASLSLDELRALKRDAKAVASQLDRLMSTLTSDDEELRAWASDCLELVEADGIHDLATLEAAATDIHPPVAGWACKLLGRAAQPRSETALVAALSLHPCLTVRQHAAAALTRFTDLTEAARAALQAASQSDDPRLKRLALGALESVG